MAVKISKIEVWAAELQDRPGGLASILQALADANSSVECLIARRQPDMKLELRDWRDASSLEKMTDGELFWIISSGKGKMPGEGERTAEKVRWNFVSLVRSFAKKGAGEKAKSESSQN